MARPRPPIGTFGEIYFERAPGGRARAFAHHIEVLELPRGLCCVARAGGMVERSHVGESDGQGQLIERRR